jgi:hypothetical protein
MRRFSTRKAMVLVAVVAAGLAALKNASDAWAGAMLLFALAAVGAAIVGAVMMRGRERAWWAAFAFFAGGYLVLTVAPGFSADVGQRLATTKALDFLYSAYFASTSRETLPEMLWWQHARVRGEVNRLRAENRQPDDLELDSAIRSLESLEIRVQDAVDKRDFIREGHSLFALLAGVVGGLVASGFYARRGAHPILSPEDEKAQ